MSAKLLPIVEQTLEQNQMNYKVLECAPEYADTAAFCEYYQVSIEQSANTIIVASRKIEPTKYAVCIVLGTTKLDVNKTVCRLLKVKKASFANAVATQELTGMEIGGVTAIGINGLPIYVDSAVMQQVEIIMGGGNRSSKLLLAPKEIQKLKNLKIIEGLAHSKDK